jgi:hypothetical protein
LATSGQVFAQNCRSIWSRRSCSDASGTAFRISARFTDSDSRLFEDGAEAEVHLRAITAQDIHGPCVKNHLARFAQLNETLYLHFSAFQKIDSLDPDVNLTSIWLNNSINVLEGFSSLKQLVCLHLQGNIFQRIDGLAEPARLAALVLSHNYVTKIENLATLLRLHTLEIDHNSTASGEGVLEVRTVRALNLRRKHRMCASPWCGR